MTALPGLLSFHRPNGFLFLYLGGEMALHAERGDEWEVTHIRISDRDANEDFFQWRPEP